MDRTAQEQKPTPMDRTTNMNQQRRWQILTRVAAVLAILCCSTPAHAFVHPFARPVGGICSTVTSGRNQPTISAASAAMAAQSARPRPAATTSMSTGDSGDVNFSVNENDSLSRAEAVRRVGSAVLKGGGVALAGVLLSGMPRSAFALDEEQEQFDEFRDGLEIKKKEEELAENLRLLTSAAAGLKTLNTKVEEKEYVSIRQAMRIPPISNLRLSAKKVIAGLGDEGAKAKTQAAYAALISSVEELDRLAKKGEQGGLKDDKGIVAAYDKCIERGDTLVSSLPMI